MSRIVGFILFILLFVGVAYFLRYLWRKFIRSVNEVLEKGSDLAQEQQQKWKQREERKKLPQEIQKLILQYEALLKFNDDLSNDWKQSFQPLYASLGDIVHILTNSPKKMNKVRNLFTVSVPALEKLLGTLKTDQKFLDANETERARISINFIAKDLEAHKQTLHKSRRFDFDVLMDVIRVRMKK